MTDISTTSNTSTSHAGPAGSTRDGRTERRQRNRAAVLDAVIQMFAEGVVAPAMDDVADRAAVSVRSVYRYFDTREQLVRAAVERLLLAATPLMVDSSEVHGDLETRARRLAHQRITLYLRFAPLARAAISIGRTDPLVQEIFEFGRDALRQQFLDLFDHELRAHSARDRTFITVLATLSLQFHAFDHLHHTCGCSPDEMERMVIDQMLLHLTAL